jgi:hypothetical protein
MARVPVFVARASVFGVNRSRVFFVANDPGNGNYRNGDLCPGRSIPATAIVLIATSAAVITTFVRHDSSVLARRTRRDRTIGRHAPALDGTIPRQAAPRRGKERSRPTIACAARTASPFAGSASGP